MIKILLENVGGLSNTSKMPCKSYGLPAKACQTGSKLRKIPGSVCSSCYAHKGAYSWPKVSAAYRRRLDAIDKPDWVDNMATLINREKSGVFRWHDSGDIQNLEHYEKIIAVCKLTPKIRHWLPTKEKKILNSYKETTPENLVVRLSGTMIDGPPPATNHNTSTVHTTNPAGVECTAYKRGGECGECRDCWNPKIKNISYKKH